MTDFLPDSRTRERKGSIYSAEHGNLIPIFCANCGKEWGMVPENFITFAFALCNDCEKFGDIAHTYKEPDSVFWERVNNAMREEEEKAKQVVTPALLAEKLEDPSSVFTKLADEWLRHIRSR